MIKLTISDNVLPQVLAEIREAGVATLNEVGEIYREVAQNKCPVSNIDEPGYVHLIETINFMVDVVSVTHQSWVTMFVLKHYAQWVNDGTSRMAPRPFHTDGVQEAVDAFEAIALQSYSELRLGRGGTRK